MAGLAVVAMKLFKLNVVGENGSANEEEFRQWLHEFLSPYQMQMVYTSPLYKGFLEHRFAQQLKDAKAAPAARKGLLPALHETAPAVEKATILMVMKLLDETEGNLLSKLELLWKTPNAVKQLEEWGGLSKRWAVWTAFSEQASTPQWQCWSGGQLLKCMCSLVDAGGAWVPNVALRPLLEDCKEVRQTKNKVLEVILQEQIVLRIGAATPAAEVCLAEEAAPAALAELLSDKTLLATAKSLCKRWRLAVKQNAAAAECPRLSELQVALKKQHAATGPLGEDSGERTEKEDRDKEKTGEKEPKRRRTGDKDEKEPGDQEKDKETAEETGCMDDKKTDGAGDKGAEAAPATVVPIREFAAGDEVLISVKKFKELYDGCKAKVLRCLTKHIVVSFLNGQCKGEQKKLSYGNVLRPKSASAARAPAASAAPVAASSAAGAAAAGTASASAAPAAAINAAASAQQPTEKTTDTETTGGPDKECLDMFGLMNFDNY